jgi:hypothetical protein
LYFFPSDSIFRRIQISELSWRLHYPKNPELKEFIGDSTVRKWIQSVRYAPMNHSHIPGFPNRMPCIDWQTYLPKFKDEEGDDVALHLIKFHMHTHKLKVKFHEDCLMKMFMATLEGKGKILV